MEIPNKSNGEHYNLRWNSYTNNLIQVLLEHQHHENLVDVTLCCEGQFIKAHKLVLSACSEVFQDMFRVHNVQHPVIILNDIKFKHFKYILEFIYQGEVKVLDIDLEGVLALGENLQVKGLSSIKLKQQASTEEQKALNRSPNKREYNPRTLPNSPALFSQNVLNCANNTPSQAKPKDLTLNNQVQANDLRNPLLRKFPSDGQIQADLKNVQMGNGNLNTDSSKNISKLESILTDPNEKVQRKRHKRSEKSPVSNSGSEDITNSENFKDMDKNSRPANAFMIFANEWRKKLKVEHPEENNKAISLRLGNMWKSLSNETKQCYYLAARKMERDQNIQDLESIPITDSPKRKKVERRKTIDSISHLVSVDLQEFDDDDDDLQIIEVKETPPDESKIPENRDCSPEDPKKT